MYQETHCEIPQWEYQVGSWNLKFQKDIKDDNINVDIVGIQMVSKTWDWIRS